MRLRKRYLSLVVLLGAAVAVLPGLASGSAPSTASFTASDFEWKVSGSSEKTVTIAVGGTVTFSYPSGTSKHNADFGSGASPTSCTQTAPTPTEPVPPLPHTPTAQGWSGSCTFNVAGTYAFHCDAHSNMTGTITVKAPSTPTAVTGAPTGVTQTAATLNGSVSPEGEATSYYFEYGTTAAMPEKIPLTPQSVGSDFAEHPVSATLTNLAPATEYHFELIAKYGSNTVHGVERTFTTRPLEEPTVTTGGTSARGETEATLHGTVSPGGEATEYWFEYGTTNVYGSKTEKKSLSASGSDQSVEATLTKLAPGTEYHYRLVAENHKGIRGGTDSAFTTMSPPAKKSEPPSEAPSGGTTTTPAPTQPVIASALPKPEEKLVTLPAPLVAGSVKLSTPRHGSTVHGSLDIAQSGAGGRLEVDLLSKGASLAKARHGHPPKQVTVGRLVRTSVHAGRMSFSVALNARGKSALRRHHRLALTVKIKLTPTQGNASTITVDVVLHR